MQNQSQASPPETPSSSGTQSPTLAASPAASALAITNADFHPGEVGFTYNPALALAATGGTGTYTWSVSAGALPGGLTLTPNGSVYGDPTAAGTFHFTVQVADTRGATATAAKSVSIAPALKASLIPACARACSVEVGCVTVCGKFGSISGGAGPFTYALQPGGYVPLGTAVSKTDLSLTGTFTTVAKYWQFTILVRDSSGGAATITPTFYVFPHITFLGGLCKAWENCTVQLRYSVGISGTPTVKVGAWTGTNTCSGSTCPAPPIKTTVRGGIVTIVLGPTYYPNNPTGTFKLILSDQNLCAAGVHCSATAVLTVDLNYG